MSDDAHSFVPGRDMQAVHLNDSVTNFQVRLHDPGTNHVPTHILRIAAAILGRVHSRVRTSDGAGPRSVRVDVGLS